MPSYDISNSDKIIDASDVRKRIAELEEEIDFAVQEHFGIEDSWDDLDESEKEEKRSEWVSETDDGRRDELKALQNFADEIGTSNLQHGETLIHEDHFEEYAEELAADLHGSAVTEAAWPFNCIDWEKAAEQLKGDYTGADWDGVTYYFRS